MISPIESIKGALSSALESIPKFNSSSYFEKGKIVDKSIKSILKELMDWYGMVPGTDYVDNLRDNEPSTDFVTLTSAADELITGLMNGSVIAISAHSRTNSNGDKYEIQAHLRKKAS
jgi:hypothetical protein